MVSAISQSKAKPRSSTGVPIRSRTRLLAPSQPITYAALTSCSSPLARHPRSGSSPSPRRTRRRTCEPASWASLSSQPWWISTAEISLAVRSSSSSSWGWQNIVAPGQPDGPGRLRSSSSSVFPSAFCHS